MPGVVLDMDEARNAGQPCRETAIDEGADVMHEHGFGSQFAQLGGQLQGNGRCDAGAAVEAGDPPGERRQRRPTANEVVGAPFEADDVGGMRRAARQIEDHRLDAARTHRVDDVHHVTWSGGLAHNWVDAVKVRSNWRIGACCAAICASRASAMRMHAVPSP